MPVNGAAGVAAVLVLPPVIPLEPVATPANPASTSETAADTPEKKEDDTKKDDESNDEKEMKARKEELDALNAEYKDIPHCSEPMIVHLDKRWDKNGDEYYIRQKKADVRTPGSDWWQKHVLAVIRHLDEFDSETVEQTNVEVYSKHLRNTLAKVIDTYSLVSFHTEHVSLVLPAECLH
ncbi:hypothetical protein DFH08DRAFT_1018720 [Mycena albidolilacea]|uniref:Uncharacterized protein n=1 Tax=Mycena albidolilacea TaxID=1033008 RepID=A0AAD6ZSG6_9AGAR|nr:hypothetical protein DFH08DRAFT_1018720 [Mycena albidolilacea]